MRQEKEKEMERTGSCKKKKGKNRKVQEGRVNMAGGSETWQALQIR